MNKELQPLLFERLKKSLQDGIAHARGEMKLNSIEHPLDPPEIDSATLLALRTQTTLTQTRFAELLSTSMKAVQSWEKGERSPPKAIRRLVQIFVLEPAAMCRAVGLPPVELHGFEIQQLSSGKTRLVHLTKQRSKKTSKA